jgi:CubicO group peptidase (beta-lactamase class C family)
MPTLDPVRWKQVAELAQRWTAEKKFPAVTFVTGTVDQLHGPVSFGTQTVDGQAPLVENPIYLIASITKPIVAMAALQLVEQGQLRLADRVVEYIPEFGKQGKYSVELRHLFTHTSGLPDMLPNNVALRKANAPLSKFLAEICEIPLSFPAGRGVQYQSTGLLVLAEILFRVTGKTCADYLRSEMFEPLGMCDSELGVPDGWYAPNAAVASKCSKEQEAAKVARIPELHVPPEQAEEVSWNWNSKYWRQLGAPWGGMLTTAGDLARFCQMMLRGGLTADGTRLFSPALIDAATKNQLDVMPSVPEDERRCRPWGLGWRLNWPAHSASFGDLLSDAAYGHWGATGTLMWIDPARGTFAIVFSTEPHDISGPRLIGLSNAITAAWV